MPIKAILLSILFLVASFLHSQTGVGIGFYPTGTEAGIGFRSGKNSLACLDARVGKATFTSKTGTSSFLSELNVVFRVVNLEKVKFHIDLGARGEWNIDRPNKYGAVVPIGVEAFPFPFQNAGLFFEVAAYYASDWIKDYNAGLRAIGGFVFYFPTEPKVQPEVKQ